MLAISKYFWEKAMVVGLTSGHDQAGVEQGVLERCERGAFLGRRGLLGGWRRRVFQGQTTETGRRHTGKENCPPMKRRRRYWRSLA